MGTENSELNQGDTTTVPTVPTVPGAFEEFRRPTRAEQQLQDRAAWEERASVLEFEGGMEREAAEQAAADELGYRPTTPVIPRRRFTP